MRVLAPLVQESTPQHWRQATPTNPSVREHGWADCDFANFQLGRETPNAAGPSELLLAPVRLARREQDEQCPVL